MNKLIKIILFSSFASIFLYSCESKKEKEARLELEHKEKVQQDSIRLANEKAEYDELKKKARDQGYHDGYLGYYDDSEIEGYNHWFHDNVFMKTSIRTPNNEEAKEEFHKPLRRSYIEGRKEGIHRQDSERKAREREEARNQGYKDGYNGYQGWDAVSSFDRWFDKKYGIPQNAEVAKKFKELKKSLRESYTDGLKEGHQAAINAGHF